MAATVTILNPQHQAISIDGLRARLVKVTFGSADYPAHGYNITPNSLGLAEILGVVVLGTTTTDPGNAAVFTWSTGTNKLLAYGAAGSATGLTELSGSAQLNDHTVILLAIGH